MLKNLEQLYIVLILKFIIYLLFKKVLGKRLIDRDNKVIWDNILLKIRKCPREDSNFHN